MNGNGRGYTQNKQDERCLMNDEDSRMQVPAIDTLPAWGSSLRRWTNSQRNKSKKHGIDESVAFDFERFLLFVYFFSP